MYIFKHDPSLLSLNSKMVEKSRLFTRPYDFVLNTMYCEWQCNVKCLKRSLLKFKRSSFAL